jgi:hypothetical protein
MVLMASGTGNVSYALFPNNPTGFGKITTCIDQLGGRVVPVIAPKAASLRRLIARRQKLRDYALFHTFN